MSIATTGSRPRGGLVPRRHRMREVASGVPPERQLEIDAFISSIVDQRAAPTRSALGRVTSAIAARRELWEDLVVHDADERWYAQLHHGTELDVWLLSWVEGQETDWHDHGGSAGSFAVATGEVTEHFRRGARMLGERVLATGQYVAFGPGHVHDVSHYGDVPAVSVHCYSPPLTVMTFYERHLGRFRATETVRATGPDGRGWKRLGPYAGVPRPIDELLAEARLGLDRLGPREVAKAMKKGAVLVDIRPAEYRKAEGVVPGSVIIERNVLEWRLDPTSEARLSGIADYERQIILMCNEGYASSLAAVDLRRIGLVNVADMEGGYRSWRAAGLPTAPDTEE